MTRMAYRKEDAPSWSISSSPSSRVLTKDPSCRKAAHKRRWAKIPQIRQASRCGQRPAHIPDHYQGGWRRGGLDPAFRSISSVVQRLGNRCVPICKVISLATTAPFGPTMTASSGPTRWTTGRSEVVPSRAAARRKSRSKAGPDQGDTGVRQTVVGPIQAVQAGPTLAVIAIISQHSVAISLWSS
jgi:hypothetical protein